MGTRRKEAPEKDRRKNNTEPKLKSKAIPPELEAEMMKITGLTKGALYNRRGGISERGLAALLEPGDTIVEILDDHVVIQTKDGATQTFWNFDKDLPFLKKAGDDMDVDGKGQGNNNPS